MRNREIAGIFADARKRPLVSLCWLPYCYLLLFLVSAMALGLLGAPADTVWIVSLLWVPLGWAAVAVAIGVIVARSTEEGALPCVAWAAALPARGWAWVWGTLATLLFARFFWSLLVLAVVGFTGIVTALMIFGGAPWWLTLIVCVGVLFLTAGGAKWGNQHGSGYTGAVPLGPIILVCIGIWAWVVTLALSVIALISAPWFAVRIALDPWSAAWGLGLSTEGIIAMIALVLVTCVLPYALDIRLAASVYARPARRMRAKRVSVR